MHAVRFYAPIIKSVWVYNIISGSSLVNLQKQDNAAGKYLYITANPKLTLTCK